MLKKHSTSIINLIKVALTQFKAAFFASIITTFFAVSFFLSLPSCAPTFPTDVSSLKSNQPSRVLSTKHTHTLLKKWSENHYQSTPDHLITIKSHHPHISDLSLKEHPYISSGYSINRFTHRTDGIGLPALIKLKTNHDSIFTPITSDTYLSNLRPISIVATQSSKSGITQTHFDIYDPHDDKHLGQALKRQPNIVMQYIQDLPGNSSLDIQGLIRPSKFSKHQGFYLAEPYDKKRIPVIMIHGLASSPETYAEMADAINANPKLREKYQLWYYFYPTGTPWLVTASKFRNTFRNLIKTLDPDSNDSNLRNITLIGHSMGGLISRLSLSTPGNSIQQAYFGKAPLDQIVDKKDLKDITDYFHFKPLTEPTRVIYLATPHRGSRIAEGLIGSIAIKLITLPTNIIKQTAGVLTTGQLIGASIPEQTKKLLTTGESSINQLQPSNPSIKALNQMQVRKDIAAYSIIGDIGKPLFKFRTDGVVSHKSSKFSNNVEQIIIPSDHDVCGEQEAINAVLRILSN